MDGVGLAIIANTVEWQLRWRAVRYCWCDIVVWARKIDSGIFVFPLSDCARCLRKVLCRWMLQLIGVRGLGISFWFNTSAQLKFVMAWDVREGLWLLDGSMLG